MTSSDFTTSISVDQSPAEVFAAINNVRGWWSEEIEGHTSHPGDEFNYHYQDVHRCKMKVTESIPGQKIVWQVLDNYFSFTHDKNEWKGNTILFELSVQDDKTVMKFTQVGLVPGYECFDICENAWNTYIQKSLYNLVTTGKGQPNGKDKPQTEDERSAAAKDFTISLFVNETPREVFHAVNNVKGWWQGEIEGSNQQVGDEFSYRMKDIHYSRQRVMEMVADQKLVWLVTDSQLNFITTSDEWTGTTIVFEIKEINNKTQLRFTHKGLVPENECYNSCSNGWLKLIQQGLLSLITTGKGKEVF